ncbi:MAG: DUF302 domain-containing protein [Pseudobdellovibrionaceae bacterium]
MSTSHLAFKKECLMSVDQAVEKVSEALKGIGFGILTRIDFDQKIQEKLGEKIPKTVILGACNPKLALEAFKQSTDTALLIPCNVVVRETTAGKCIVEAMKPSQMLNFLKDVTQSEAIAKAEADLEKTIQAL